MKIQSRSFLTGYSLTLCLALVGCGGGGGTTTPSSSDDPTPTTSKSTYSVSGTVPGTLIEAFCKDGSYYSVNSTDDGTANHPFTLELPSSIDCKFVMTTNEKDVDTSKHIVTPLLFNNGTTTSSYFQLSNNVELGHVALPMTGEGVQTPLTVSLSNQEMDIHYFSYDPLDVDNDGVPNVYEDDDNDGTVNKYDEDDDDDGILDTEDSDYTNDSDGDGIENSYDQDDDSSNTRTTTTVVLPISYKADAGRLLGSQCAQCHGTNGRSVNSWESIAGEGDLAGEIYEDEEPIMSAQAHGYSSEEITLIGNWLKTL